MRIAHIVFGMKTGGIETMLVNLANIQALNEHDKIGIFIINNLVNNNILSRLNNRIKVCRINRPVGSKNPWYLMKLNYNLWRFNPDTIHIHKANIVNYLSRTFLSKTCLTQHESIIDEDLKPAKKINRIFSISDSVACTLKARTECNSTVIYNGIATENFRSKPKRYSPGDTLKCVCIARLSHTIKGQHILIQALSILKKKEQIKIHVDFIGAGESLLYLKELSQSLEVDDSMSFIGEQSQQYIETGLCEYDLFILPSLNEGFGLSVIEAMAAGVPVLVSDIPGPGDIVDHGITGFKFKSNDPRDCALKLSEIATVGIPDEIIGHAMLTAKRYSITNTAKQYRLNYD